MKIKHKGQLLKCRLDPEDEKYFSNWTWSYRCGYAGRKRQKQDKSGGHWVHLHREVLVRAGLTIPKGIYPDHINRNKLDNRKSNLRLVTKSENNKNLSKETLIKKRSAALVASNVGRKLPRTKKQLAVTYANLEKMFKARGIAFKNTKGA